MQKILKSGLFLFGLLLLMSSCAVKSTVSIPPKEEFILGEYQNSRFSAKVSNLSNQEVKVVVVETQSGEQTQGFGLPAKNSAQIYVSKKETVIFKNPSDETVRVKARLGRDVQGMRYQAVSKQ